MLWIRATTFKQKNSQPLTQPEKALLTLTEHTAFNVPESILLQVRQWGNIVSKIKQHLYPCFPLLPTSVIQGFGGNYGTLDAPGSQVDDTIQHLYKEISCLDVTSEAVCASISDLPPDMYNSGITFLVFSQMLIY